MVGACQGGGGWVNHFGGFLLVAVGGGGFHPKGGFFTAKGGVRGGDFSYGDGAQTPQGGGGGSPRLG